MGKHFNPRYILGDDNETIVGIAGIREDVFLRTLSLCEDVFGQEILLDDRVTGVKEHRSEQAETIAALRNGGHIVNYKRDVTIKLDAYNPRKNNQPLQLQRVKSVLTTAFLKWGDKADPDNYVQVRLDGMKLPQRLEGRDKSFKGSVPLSVDDQRFYYTHIALEKNLQDLHSKLYSPWRGAKRGSFGRVVDMGEFEVKARKRELENRLAWKRDMEKMFANFLKM